MSHSAESDVRNAGFTLIEVLVALSIVGLALSSIGALMASAARTNRSVESHLSIVEAARSVLTALPDRSRLIPGGTAGKIDLTRYRITVMPYANEKSDSRFDGPWIPQSIVVSVQSPTGVAMELRTIRLRHRSGG